MDPVKRLNREVRAKGTVITLYKDTVIANGHEEEWDYIHHDGAAAVVAVNDEGKLVMVRQYRNALDRFTLELPAGKLDASDEPTLSCAKRELEEETGYYSEDLEFLLTVNTTVAFCNEKIDIYVATGLTPGKQHLDEDEYVDVKAYTLEELIDKILKGEIQDSKTVSAILAYKEKYRN